MAYANTVDVAGYCANLINNAGDFSGSTLPTNLQVMRWLSSGCAIINTRLTARGYGLPASGTDPYEMLTYLNAIYAAAQAEMARTNVRLSPGERTRGQVLMEDFKKGLEDFLKGDLSRAGLAYTHAGYVGGISQSDHDATDAGADRIPTRFTKNQFNNPGGAIDPNSQNRNQ